LSNQSCHNNASVNSKKHNNLYDPMKADLFSSATTLFLMVMRSPPFRRAHLKDPYFKRLCSVDRKSFWNIFKSISSSADFRDLFESLTRREPDERPGLLHILKHPWLSTDDRLSLEHLEAEILSRYSIIEKAINSKQKEKVDNSSSYEESSSSIEMIIKDHEDFEILRI